MIIIRKSPFVMNGLFRIIAHFGSSQILVQSPIFYMKEQYF